MGEIFKLFGTIGLDNSEANKGIDETTGKARDSSNKMVSFFQGAAKVIGALFLGGALISFAKSTVEAAASAKAIQAQFEQVFGNVGSDAQKQIDKMGKAFGMLPSRIKPSFTQATSMFKGLGLSTEEAMVQAEKSVTMAANAAAFYDKSYEDANSALNSFIKGNYEGGEAIGLFGNETQISAWAAKELKVDWKNLDEAGKQVARLKFAEAMQEAAGATGQAARESEGYENQLGNMKQAWTDFKAIVGTPILGVAIQGLQLVTSWLQTAATKVQEFASFFSDGMNGAGDPAALSGLEAAFYTLGQTVTTVKDTYTTFKDGLIAAKQWMADNETAMGTLGIAFTTLGIAILTFNAMTIIGAIGSGAMTVALTAMYIAEGVAAGATTALSTALAFLFSPVTLVIAIIGALIAVGYLIVKNWDTIKAKAGELGTAIAAKFTEMKEKVAAKIEEMKTAVTNKFNEIKTNATEKFNAIKTAITTAINNAKESVTNTFNNIKSSISEKVDAVKSKVTSVFSSIKEAMSKPFEAARDAIKSVIDKIKGFLNFKWSLPHLKMPSINISGKFSIAPPSVPKFDLKWNADGAIFTKPTIFGSNNGVLQGAGEAGTEAALPLNSKTLGAIGKGIVDAMGGSFGDSTSRDVVKQGDTQINFNGSYTFQDKKDIDYFMNQSALLINRGKA